MIAVFRSLRLHSLLRHLLGPQGENRALSKTTASRARSNGAPKALPGNDTHGRRCIIYTKCVICAESPIFWGKAPVGFRYVG